VKKLFLLPVSLLLCLGILAACGQTEAPPAAESAPPEAAAEPHAPYDLTRVGNTALLRAYDDEGNVLWSYSAALPEGKEAVDLGDTAYGHLLHAGGKLLCIDFSDIPGSLLWSRETAGSVCWGFDAGENIYIGDENGLTVCDGDGKVLRHFQPFLQDAAPMELTVPGDGTVLLTYDNGCVVTADLRSTALSVTTEAELRLLMTGYWDYYLPGEDSPALELFLTSDGHYHAYRRTPEGADPGREYVGEWSFTGDESSLPSGISLPFLGKTYDGDIPGFSSLGDYAVADIAVWDGAYCLCLEGQGETDFFRTLFGDAHPVLRKRTETDILPAAYVYPANAEFTARCWGIEEAPGGMTLYLSAENGFRASGGQLPAALSYTLPNTSPLYRDFSALEAAGFALTVRTDADGAPTALTR